MDWSEFIMGITEGTIIGACVTLVVALVTVAGSIYNNSLINRKGYKDIDTKIGQTPENRTLSQQHTDLQNNFHQIANENQKELLAKIGVLPNTTLSGQNINIIAQVKDLKDTFESAQKEEFSKRQLLTGHQESIVQSISVLSSFQKEMMDLQKDKLTLLKQVDTLTQENSLLKEQIADLQEQLGMDEQLNI